MSDPMLDQMRAQAQELLRSLKGPGGDEDVARSKDLVENLRNIREYEHTQLIKPAVVGAELEPIRTDEEQAGGVIHGLSPSSSRTRGR